MGLTVRVKGGNRVTARGAKTKRAAGEMGVSIISDAERPKWKPRSYPPALRLKKLRQMLAQNQEALDRTRSFAAYKRKAVLLQHIQVAEAELSLPAVW
jgi:hypothetical protein